MQTYRHDRLLARTVLRLIPKSVTPNMVTIVRLVLTPLAVWLIYTERYAVGIPFFLLVAFTDALDGSMARVRDEVTQWGMVWDPIADKVLIGSVAFILLFSKFPPDFTVVILGLEGIFLVGGYFRKRQGRIVSANRWGKMKMLCQVIGVSIFMLSVAIHAPWLAPVSYGVLIAAMVFAVISLFTHGL